MKLTTTAARAAVCAALTFLLVSTAQAQALRDLEVEPASLNWTDAGDASFALIESGGEWWYAVSHDGGASLDTVRRLRPIIKLRAAEFDPALTTPTFDPALRSPQTQLHLVQFFTQPLNAYNTELARMGAEVLHHVPHQAALVRMSDATAMQVNTLPFVRWVGRYDAAFRLEEETTRLLLTDALQSRRYNIQVTKQGLTEKLAVAAAIETAGGAVDDYISPHGALLTAELSREQLLMVVNRDDVLFVDPWSTIETDLDVVRQFNGADFLESVGGYTGEGVRGQVRDSGLLFTHSNYQANPPIPHNGTAGSQSHGTSVYGVVFGTGDDDPTARGILPDGQGVFHSSGTTVDRFIETAELLQNPYRCVFETNSTGNARTFFYTTISADMDNILFQNDVVVLQSQSNAGNQDSRPQAWAKNIISVGGIRHQNTLTDADDTWNFGGSIGPADDGRIKPDISAFYDNTRTTSSNGGYTNTFGGTSNATPVTAGHVGLIHQMWADGAFGNSLVNWDVFDNKPTSMLAKALLLNSTTQYSFSGTADDLTRVHQGWGRPDVQRLWNIRDRMIWVDETDVLPPFQSSFYTVNVTAADPEFRATLVYRDLPGNPAATVHRINDITLRVTDPGGTVYFGNNGLLANNTSTSGGVDNQLDTVEQVIVANPAPGQWVVEIIAQDIVQDSHPETPALDADYALVVSGVDPEPTAPFDVGQANSSSASLSVFNSLDTQGRKPNPGVNGPFFANLTAGQRLELRFQGDANESFLLFMGPLNRNNLVVPGVGSLDLGTTANLSDVALLLDGVNGTSFFDAQARVGSDGRQSLSFTIPPTIPPGVLGAFQAMFWDVGNAVLEFTAAAEVTIQ